MTLTDRLEAIYNEAFKEKDFAQAVNAALLLERAEKESKPVIATPNVQI